MIRVGIMGAIGSGKSFISKLFNSPVFNADREVDILYKSSLECYEKLRKKLPRYVKSFPISKTQLIKAINEDKRNLKKISSVVHPLVRKKMKLFLNKNKRSKIIILEILLNLRKNQANLLKKRKLANYIIDNNFGPNIMKKKINSLKNKILDERNST